MTFHGVARPPLIVFFLFSSLGWVQIPVINPDGIVNAASFVAAPKLGHALVHGSIATLFGENLATTTTSASTLPLPTVLAGTSVTVAGRPAPLFFVSPGQINFQVPEQTSAGLVMGNYRTVPVFVTSTAGISDSVVVDTFETSPGLFTLDGSGCGRGVILNVKADGALSLNSPSNSAEPGDFLEIFGTGHSPSDSGSVPGRGGCTICVESNCAYPYG